eukprot:scaffold9773_cov151-Skeletonema_marinoi.AAC.8
MDFSLESAQQASLSWLDLSFAEFVKPIPITRVQVQQQCCEQRGHDVALALELEYTSSIPTIDGTCLLFKIVLPSGDLLLPP